VSRTETSKLFLYLRRENRGNGRKKKSGGRGTIPLLEFRRAHWMLRSSVISACAWTMQFPVLHVTPIDH
jgi:hypothetical protein